MRIRVTIVLNRPLIRFGLTTLLAGDADFEVAGEFSTRDEALGAIAELQPGAGPGG